MSAKGFLLLRLPITLMLSAKEILQIDATILAGIFILMTINSVLSGGTLTDQMQKTDDKLKQLRAIKTSETNSRTKIK